MTTSPANPKVAEIQHSVESSYLKLNALITGELAALDPAKLYHAPSGDEWTIMQDLAHIREFMVYWADEIEKLVAAPGQKFGRTHQHEGRLSGISEHESDTLEHIHAALPGSYKRLQDVLSTLKDSDLTIIGLHPKYDAQTLEWFIEFAVTGHLREHLEQLHRYLAAK